MKMTKTKSELTRAEKAKNMRYKKSALQMLQRETIDFALSDIMNNCEELAYAVEDDDTLADIFDGDTDEIQEFRFAFSDLSAKCEELMGVLQDEYVNEHFDDFLVGSCGNAYKCVGYDDVQEDYFELCHYEAEMAQAECGKRLQRLTKQELITVAGQSIGVFVAFLSIQNEYDRLESVFALLRDERAELIRDIRAVNEEYEKLQEDPCNRDKISRFDTFVNNLPPRVWVE
jgi:hypothetical protein